MKHNWTNTTKNIGLFCTLIITYLFNTNTSVTAAENVVLRYGLLEESISVTDLKSIAKTGQVPQKYKVYTNKFPLEKRQKFLEVLRKKIPINFVTLTIPLPKKRAYKNFGKTGKITRT